MKKTAHTEARGWIVAGLMLMATIPAGRGAIAFSVLEEGHWIVYHQDTLGGLPTGVDRTNTEDQTSVRLSPTGAVAFETPRSEVKVFRRGEAPGTWEWIATHPSAVRPAWHSGMADWAFVRFAVTATGEDSDLWAKRPGKAAPELLVRQTGNQDYPGISPDGRLMVYVTAQVVSMKLGAVQVFQQVWMADFHRAQVRQILLDPGAHIEPAWSPSGNEIALAANRTGQFEIWTLRPDGTGMRQVTTGPGAKTRPTWSPDGRQLMVTVLLEGNHGLALVDVSSGALNPYTPFPDRPKAEVRDADWR